MDVPVPMTWNAGHKPTADDMNREIRDALEFILNPPRALIYRSTDFSMTSSTEYTVSLSSVLYDTDDITTTASRLTIKTAGAYLLVARYRATPAGTTGSGRISIYQNGGAEPLVEGVDVFQSSYVRPQTSILVELNANDYLQMKVYQNSGETKTFTGGSNWNHLLALRVANL